MQWEKCKIDNRSSRWRKRTVWLSKTGANARLYSKLNISKDICEEAGFKAGDSIWLYKGDGKFLLKKEPSDFYLKTSTGSPTTDADCTLSLTNQNFVLQILAGLRASSKEDVITTFDAFVTEEGIVFEPRKEA